MGNGTVFAFDLQLSKDSDMVAVNVGNTTIKA